jgi:hypothetical protein
MGSDKRQMGFRVESDVAEAIEQYADENDISKSDALRRITRDWYQENYSGNSAGLDEVFAVAPLKLLAGATLWVVGGFAGLEVWTWIFGHLTGAGAPLGEALPFWIAGAVAMTAGSILISRASTEAEKDRAPAQLEHATDTEVAG